MPVKRIKSEPVDHSDLIDRLVHVLQEDRPEGPPGDPRITIEEIRHSSSLHVTVVWDEWKDIDPEERGRIILDAVGKGLGEREMLRVTMALGLTEQEARRLNVPTVFGQ